MAQVRAADRAGTGAGKFAAALAKASAGELLVRLACAAWARRNCCDAATALVPGLVSALVAAWILFQPVYWTMRVVAVLCFYRHAARICVALDWQRSVATQTASQSGHLLATIQRLQSARPALLKVKSCGPKGRVRLPRAISRPTSCASRRAFNRDGSAASAHGETVTWSNKVEFSTELLCAVRARPMERFLFNALVTLPAATQFVPSAET